MSTYGVPPFMLGKNVTIQITPQTVAADGTFSAASIGALPCNGRIDQDMQDLTYSMDNISPRDAFNSNPVPFEVGSTFTITEIAQAWPLWSSRTAVWGQGNTLETCAELSLYHYVQVTALENDLSTVIQTWSAYCVLVSHKRTSPKQKNTYEATFQTVLVANTGTGAFQSNPALTNAA